MTLQIDIPNHLPLTEFEVKMQLAASFFDRGILSSGQAAELAGISKRAFIEIVGQYGVSIFQYDEAELAAELDSLGLS